MKKAEPRFGVEVRLRDTRGELGASRDVFETEHRGDARRAYANAVNGAADAVAALMLRLLGGVFRRRREDGK